MNALSRFRLARISSVLAPIVLVTGFVVGAARQPSDYDSLRDTISALAGRGATDRWIMTAPLLALGLCHLVTSYALSRPVLAVGGLCTVGLAIAAEPATGSSAVHGVFATIAFIALALWPLPQDRIAVGVLVIGLVWFWVELQTNDVVGLAERCVAVAEAIWPIVVVSREYARVRPATP